MPGGGTTHPFAMRKDAGGNDDPIDLPAAVDDASVFYLRATFSNFANNHNLRIDNFKVLGNYNPPDDSCGNPKPPVPDTLISYWSFNNVADNYEPFCETAADYGEVYVPATKRLIANSGGGTLWQTGSTAPVFTNAADVYLDMSNMLGGMFGNSKTWSDGWTAFRDGGPWVPPNTGFAPASGNFSLALGRTTTTNNEGHYITFRLKSTGYGNLRMAYDLANTNDTLDTVKIIWTASMDGTNYFSIPDGEQPVLVNWDGSTFPFVPYAVALPSALDNQGVFYLRATLTGLATTHSLRLDNFRLLSASNPIVGLRPNTELFVDNTQIDLSASSTPARIFHSGVKTEDPVLRADEDWELNPNISPPYLAEAAYIALVEYDTTASSFRMWYNDAASGGMLIATSSNGVVWGKPVQSIYYVNGDNTNILTKGKGALTVLRDEGASSAERYKALFHGNGIKGLLGAYSSDGIDWSFYNNPPANNPPADPVDPTNPFEIPHLVDYGSEMAHLVRDPVSQVYRAYVRPRGPKFNSTPANATFRAGGVLMSHDFVHWTVNRDVLQPDSIDIAMAQAVTGYYGEFYSMNAYPYGRNYLGIEPLFLVTDYLADPTPCGTGEYEGNELLEPGQSPWDGPIEGQLIHSRDGFNWVRIPAVSNVRPAAIESGISTPDAFDVSIMNVASRPVIVHRADINESLEDDEVDNLVPQIASDELWHYYHGISSTHGGTFPEKKIAVGVARWRLDGYVSLEAGESQETVVTALISDRTGTLEVNADIRSGGQLTVEVLDHTGAVIFGYGLSDAVLLTGDDVAHEVTWTSHTTLPTVPFKLRFRFSDASLYSYTITP